MNRSQETERVVTQFDTPDQAARYSSEFNTNRQKRSRRCIIEAMKDLPPGSRILDLPCGTGRLLPLILQLGHRYTGADVSEHMVSAAREKLAELQRERSAQQIPQASIPQIHADLGVEDIMALSYPDDAFDAAIVNRLFHHYTMAETRITALRELKRVCTGPIIVFFLNSWTVRGAMFQFKHRNDAVVERRPISLAEFRANGRAAGLELTRTYRTRGRFNKEWYATFERIGA